MIIKDRGNLRAVLGAILVSPALATTAHTQDVAMFRGDLAHTGVYASPGISRLPAIKWRFHTDGRVIASPTVSGNTAYIGSTDGHLYAINIADGKERWRFATHARITSSAAVSDGVVYVESYDGNLYAVTAATGKLQWQFATQGARRFAGTHLHGFSPVVERMPDPFDVFLSSPAIWQHTVYFGSGDGNVYALDATSGRVEWKYQTGDVVHASPAIANGTVYIGSWDSYFYALDAKTGALQWRYQAGDDPNIHNQVGFQSSAAVVDGVVYVGCRDAQLYAFDAKTGQKKWSFDNKGSWVVGSPAVRDGKVYFATSDSHRIWAIDTAGGKPVFEIPMRWFSFSSPALAGKWLYVGNWDGTVTAVDLTTATSAWVFATEASRTQAAAHTGKDGRINFFTDPHLEPFYDTLMALVEQQYSLGAIISSPTVVDGVLYIGSADGNVYALAD
jgi:outer membrane protein assembly factor BamB